MVVAHGTSHVVCENNEFSSTTHPGAEGVFAVEVSPQDTFAPSVQLEKSEVDGSLDSVLTFFPNLSCDPDLVTPYVEAIFLVDRSGSMDRF